jgi:hypothetical protein
MIYHSVYNAAVIKIICFTIKLHRETKLVNIIFRIIVYTAPWYFRF